MPCGTFVCRNTNAKKMASDGRKSRACRLSSENSLPNRAPTFSPPLSQKKPHVCMSSRPPQEDPLPLGTAAAQSKATAAALPYERSYHYALECIRHGVATVAYHQRWLPRSSFRRYRTVTTPASSSGAAFVREEVRGSGMRSQSHLSSQKAASASSLGNSNEMPREGDDADRDGNATAFARGAADRGRQHVVTLLVPPDQAVNPSMVASQLADLLSQTESDDRGGRSSPLVLALRRTYLRSVTFTPLFRCYQDLIGEPPLLVHDEEGTSISFEIEYDDAILFMAAAKEATASSPHTAVPSSRLSSRRDLDNTRPRGVGAVTNGDDDGKTLHDLAVAHETYHDDAHVRGIEALILHSVNRRRRRRLHFEEGEEEEKGSSSSTFSLSSFHLPRQPDGLPSAAPVAPPPPRRLSSSCVAIRVTMQYYSERTPPAAAAAAFAPRPFPHGGVPHFHRGVGRGGGESHDDDGAARTMVWEPNGSSSGHSTIHHHHRPAATTTAKGSNSITSSHDNDRGLSIDDDDDDNKEEEDSLTEEEDEEAADVILAGAPPIARFDGGAFHTVSIHLSAAVMPGPSRDSASSAAWPFSDPMSRDEFEIGGSTEVMTAPWLAWSFCDADRLSQRSSRRRHPTSAPPRGPVSTIDEGENDSSQGGAEAARAAAARANLRRWRRVSALVANGEPTTTSDSDDAVSEERSMSPRGPPTSTAPTHRRGRRAHASPEDQGRRRSGATNKDREGGRRHEPHGPWLVDGRVRCREIAQGLQRLQAPLDDVAATAAAGGVENVGDAPPRLHPVTVAYVQVCLAASVLMPEPFYFPDLVHLVGSLVVDGILRSEPARKPSESDSDITEEEGHHGVVHPPRRSPPRFLGTGGANSTRRSISAIMKTPREAAKKRPMMSSQSPNGVALLVKSAVKSPASHHSPHRPPPRQRISLGNVVRDVGQRIARATVSLLAWQSSSRPPPRHHHRSSCAKATDAIHQKGRREDHDGRDPQYGSRARRGPGNRSSSGSRSDDDDHPHGSPPVAARPHRHATVAATTGRGRRQSALGDDKAGKERAATRTGVAAVHKHPQPLEETGVAVAEGEGSWGETERLDATLQRWKSLALFRWERQPAPSSFSSSSRQAQKDDEDDVNAARNDVPSGAAARQNEEEEAVEDDAVPGSGTTPSAHTSPLTFAEKWNVAAVIVGDIVRYLERDGLLTRGAARRYDDVHRGGTKQAKTSSRNEEGRKAAAYRRPVVRGAGHRLLELLASQAHQENDHDHHATSASSRIFAGMLSAVEQCRHFAIQQGDRPSATDEWSSLSSWLPHRIPSLCGRLPILQIWWASSGGGEVGGRMDHIGSSLSASFFFDWVDAGLQTRRQALESRQRRQREIIDADGNVVRRSSGRLSTSSACGGTSAAAVTLTGTITDSG